MSEYLDLGEEMECWIIDSRRPWNLYNVFSGKEEVGSEAPGEVMGMVKGGRQGVGERVGGIKVWDDGDAAELGREAEAYKALWDMPQIDDDDESDDDDDEDEDEEDGEEEVEGEGGVSLTDGLDMDGSSQTLPGGHGKKRKSSEEPDDSDEESMPRSRRQRRDSDAVSLPAILPIPRN